MRGFLERFLQKDTVPDVPGKAGETQQMFKLSRNSGGEG